MSPDAWLLFLAGFAGLGALLGVLVGYGFGWRDGYCHFAEEEVVLEERVDAAANSDGWRGEALEWRALIKAAAMRDMEIPADEPTTIHEDLFA